MNMAASTPINIQQSLGEQRQVFRSDNHKKGRAHVNVCFFFSSRVKPNKQPKKLLLLVIAFHFL